MAYDVPSWTAQMIRDFFNGKWDLDAESREYVSIHGRRYARLLESVSELLLLFRDRPGGEPLRLLDVGPGYQTELMRLCLAGVRVDTLGFADARLSPRQGEKHVAFDLNDSNECGRWPALDAYQIIVMAEVLEHLYTAAPRVLAFLSTGLEPGGLLLIQTPNACALNRRVKMLTGRNPMEPIRENRANPGHFHEFTAAELRRAAAEAGLVEVSLRLENYFDGSSWKRRAYNAASPLLPFSLREGITAVFKRVSGSSR